MWILAVLSRQQIFFSPLQKINWNCFHKQEALATEESRSFCGDFKITKSKELTGKALSENSLCSQHCAENTTQPHRLRKGKATKADWETECGKLQLCQVLFWEPAFDDRLPHDGNWIADFASSLPKHLKSFKTFFFSSRPVYSNKLQYLVLCPNSVQC